MTTRTLERLRRAIAAEDFAAATLLDREVRDGLASAPGDELLAAQRAYRAAIRDALGKRGDLARWLSELNRHDRRVARYAEVDARA